MNNADGECTIIKNKYNMLMLMLQIVSKDFDTNNDSVAHGNANDAYYLFHSTKGIFSSLTVN